MINGIKLPMHWDVAVSLVYPDWQGGNLRHMKDPWVFMHFSSGCPHGDSRHSSTSVK